MKVIMQCCHSTASTSNFSILTTIPLKQGNGFLSPSWLMYYQRRCTIIIVFIITVTGSNSVIEWQRPCWQMFASFCNLGLCQSTLNDRCTGQSAMACFPAPANQLWRATRHALKAGNWLGIFCVPILISIQHSNKGDVIIIRDTGPIIVVTCTAERCR